MRHSSLKHFMDTASSSLPRGPICAIFVEDGVEVASSVRHHMGHGFAAILVFAPPQIDVPVDAEAGVACIDYDTIAEGALESAMNALIDAFHGRWLYYCFNSEYLFFPFCEDRTVGEMVTFAGEERRDAILTYVVDLYAGDLDAHPTAVSLEDAHLDRSGYYALSRKDAWNNDIDRQHDFFGGLRWRFEEHIPKARRRIDRISLFRAKPGLKFLPDHRLSEAEYNTYSCAWHHNVTAAVCSFRTAKALKRNPGSTFEIETFQWRNSVPFEWHSRQLLDFGLMEPGQWF